MRWLGRSKESRVLSRVIKEPLFQPCDLLLSWTLDNGLIVIVAATGRCGYAFLFDARGECCSLVWLFNGPDLLDNAGWKLEPIEFPYIDPDVEDLWPLVSEDIDVTAETSEAGMQVFITIHNLLRAKLIEGYDIGLNRAVKYDHPLAWSWEGNPTPPP